MKQIFLIPLALSLLCITQVWGQPPQLAPNGLGRAGGGGFGGGGGRRGLLPDAPVQDGATAENLTRFNLDFPGGTPKALLTAIEKASGKHLNAIIPDEFAATQLPALKMNEVSVAQLFQALELASQKQEAYVTGYVNDGGGRRSPTFTHMTSSYGFKTQGQLSDDSIWFFYVSRPTSPLPDVAVEPRSCRFYSLAPYLERGLTVDDITTAIQTGWKMMGYREKLAGFVPGNNDAPTISFHPQTKLLIAVGDPAKLETIDAVLQALAAMPPAAPKARPIIPKAASDDAKPATP